MGANKLETFDIQVMKRDKIKGADYNPRRITDDAKKKIKRFLKENGLWSPLIWNKRTGVLVSGHQRLSLMDSILKQPDYELTMSVIDVDEETEVKGNVFLNNQSAMGEFDFTLLESLHDIFPSIDFEKDLGFDMSEVDLILGDIENKFEEEKKQVEQEFTSDNFREIKKQNREKAKSDNEENGSYNLDEADYQVTFVFKNNAEKADFMKRVKKPSQDKFLKSSVLLDIYNHNYNLSVFENES